MSGKLLEKKIITNYDNNSAVEYIVCRLFSTYYAQLFVIYSHE